MCEVSERNPTGVDLERGIAAAMAVVFTLVLTLQKILWCTVGMETAFAEIAFQESEFLGRFGFGFGFGFGFLVQGSMAGCTGVPVHRLRDLLLVPVFTENPCARPEVEVVCMLARGLGFPSHPQPAQTDNPKDEQT